MTAKQYLGRVHQLRRQCETLERKILMVRAKAQGIKGVTYDRDKVMASPSNTMEESIAELVHLEGKYKDLIIKYSNAIVTRIEQIQGLDEPKYVEVLTLRYIEEEPAAALGQMSFNDIADRMNYNYDYVIRLHGEALRLFEQRYLKDNR